MRNFSASLQQIYLGCRRPAVLLTLATASGIMGYGEASPFPEFGTETITECAQGLAHFVEHGHRLVNFTDFSLDIIAQVAQPYPSTARHAITQALLHIWAQEHHCPIAQLLEPNYLPQISSNGLIPKLPVDRAEARARQLFSHGYTCMKVKVGGESFADSYARLQSVCIDPAITLRVDSNQAWTTTEILSYLPHLQKLPIEYLEQPVDYRDLQGLAQIRQHIPIAIDEGVRNLSSLETIISHHCADYLILKPMFIGGILASYQLGKLAQERGLKVIVTNSVDGHWATWGALHLASALKISAPCGLSTVVNYEKFAHDPVFLLTANPQSVSECSLGYCETST